MCRLTTSQIKCNKVLSLALDESSTSNDIGSYQIKVLFCLFCYSNGSLEVIKTIKTIPLLALVPVATTCLIFRTD